MDVPRLSTLQAQLIMLKARESAPKRGYYYRSWMSVVHCVQLAKDLGLDEHYEDHQAGMSCEQSPEECQLRTRIWQTLYVTEFMVGAPQGLSPVSLCVFDMSLRHLQVATTYPSSLNQLTLVFLGPLPVETMPNIMHRVTSPTLRAW